MVKFGYSYNNIGFFALRIPQLSIEDYFTIIRYANKIYDLSKDNPILFRKIKSEIILSSYHLFSAINSKGFNDKAQEKVLYYAIRMSTRPAPHGLASGISFGKSDSASKVEFDCRGIILGIEPDMEWFMDLVSKLQEDQAIINNLILYKSPFLIKTGNTWINSNLAASNISYFATTEALDSLLQNINVGGTVTKDAIIKTLVQYPSAEYKTLLSTIIKMIRGGILFTNLLPDLIYTGNFRPMDKLIETLDKSGIYLDKIEWLHKLNEILRNPKNLGNNSVISYRKYKSIRSSMRKLLPDYNSDIIKVDSEYVLPNLSLSEEILDSINLSANIFVAFNGRNYADNYLNSYRQEFKEKYGEHTLVPFTKLIDSISGIGLPTASIRDYDSEEDIKMYTEFAMASLKSKKRYVTLSEKRLEKLIDRIKSTEKPKSMSMFVTIAAKSQKAMDSGKYKIILDSIQNYRSAISGISRFLYLGEDLEMLIYKLREEETRPPNNFINAEVLAQPIISHASNIAERKITGAYVIQFLLPNNTKYVSIPIEEIMVGMKNKRFYVSWRENILKPKYSSMLKSTLLPPVVELLLALGSDSEIKFYNNPALKYTKFIPEIRYKNIIINLSKWLIDENTNVKVGSLKEFSYSFKQFSKQMHIPRFISILDHTNKLAIDLKSRTLVDKLYKIVKSNLSKGAATILEDSTYNFIATPINIAGKHYVNSLTVPVVLKSDANEYEIKQTECAMASTASRTDKIKLPFDEWASIYVYINEAIADEFISTELSDFILKLKQFSGFKKWFFIRYKDPKFHIRVRINGTSKFLAGPAVNELRTWSNRLIKANLISKISINTYEREIEKYGGVKRSRLAEEVFNVDSEIAAGALYAILNRVIPSDIVPLTAFSFDMLLKNLGIIMQKRLYLYNTWSKDLGRYPRTNFQSDFSAVIYYAEYFQKNPSKNLFLYRSKRLKHIGREIFYTDKDATAKNSYDDIILRNYLHMHCNRFIGGQPNLENAVIILLKRYSEYILHKSEYDK